ncbi:MAG: SPASM domain-containing protein, partial [Bacilli bacterium]|nr:SPASM domain-containing protein [Bacilli bacterium]
IYQINISLHSENNKDNYLEDIFYAVDKLKYPYISYRFWTLDKSLDIKNNKYLDMIKEKYKIDKLYNNIKLDNKIYLSLDSKFTWPSTSNNYYNEIGTCLGGKRQLAILSDGTVSICCLDSEGESNLGNIFKDSMEDILNSSKYINTINNFNNNKAYLDICKHCSYKERFNNKNI